MTMTFHEMFQLCHINSLHTYKYSKKIEAIFSVDPLHKNDILIKIE